MTKSPMTIAQLAGALTFIGSIVAGFLVVDSRYVHASDYSSSQVDTQVMLQTIQIQLLENRLFEFEAKGDMEDGPEVARLLRQIKQAEDRLTTLMRRQGG